MSHDVTLPKDRSPTFPRRCLACGAADPTETFRAFTHAIGWWTVVLWSFGPRFSVEVPCCLACRLELRSQRWRRWIVEGVFVVAAALAAFYLLRSYEGAGKRWLLMGAALVGILPLFLWQQLHPVPLELTAYSKTVEYGFRDADFAAEFAALNGAEVEA